MNLLLLLGTCVVLLNYYKVNGDSRRATGEMGKASRRQERAAILKADNSNKNKGVDKKEVQERGGYIGIDQPPEVPPSVIGDTPPQKIPRDNYKADPCANGRCKGGGRSKGSDRGTAKDDNSDPYSSKEMRKFVRKLMHVARHFFSKDNGADDEVTDAGGPFNAKKLAAKKNIKAPPSAMGEAPPYPQPPGGKSGGRRKGGPALGLGSQPYDAGGSGTPLYPSGGEDEANDVHVQCKGPQCKRNRGSGNGGLGNAGLANPQPPPFEDGGFYEGDGNGIGKNRIVNQ